jgi:hypothetical protein
MALKKKNTAQKNATTQTFMTYVIGGDDRYCSNGTKVKTPGCQKYYSQVRSMVAIGWDLKREGMNGFLEE